MWATRVNSSSSHVVEDLLYRYIQDLQPFGGIAAPPETPGCTDDRNDPATWDSNCSPTENGKNPLYIQQPLISSSQITYPPGQVRGGSPYGCDDKGQCSTTICMGGLKDGQLDCDESLDCCTNTVTDPLSGAVIGCSDSGSELSVCEGVVLPSGGTIRRGVAEESRLYGFRNLRRLFADVYGVWEWTSAGYIDTKADPTGWFNTWKTSYGNMPQCTNNVRPQFNAADYDAEYCGVVPVIGVDIIEPATTSSKIINLFSGNGSVQINFVINANKDQEPIKFIAIDWGDDTGQITITGNHTSGVLPLSHEYTTLGSFNPLIKVVDNWDWCGVPEDDVTSCAGVDCRYFAEVLPATSDDCENGPNKDGFVSVGITVNVSP